MGCLTKFITPFQKLLKCLNTKNFVFIIQKYLFKTHLDLFLQHQSLQIYLDVTLYPHIKTTHVLDNS